MSIQITIQGTVRADGVLELDDRVAMPEGRVLVTVQPVPQPAADDPFHRRMEQIWAGQRARGHVPRTRAEIDAELQDLRAAAEAEFQAVERLHDPRRDESTAEEKAP